MANFTAKDVQMLRKQTGVGMMDCKTALSQSDGDMNKAIEFLRKKGIAKAAKKADRIAAEGLVFVKVENGVGVVLEVNSETDFVAKNIDFVNFVKLVADCILKFNPKNITEVGLLKGDSSGLTVEKILNDKVLSLGENIKIRRFERLEGIIGSYSHGDGKIGVIVKFDVSSGNSSCSEDSRFLEYAKNIAMHIAALNPKYLSQDKVPSDVLENEKSIMRQQVINSGKPEQVADRIVNGKIAKFYEESCLLNQQYVKDSKLTIAQYTKNVSSELCCGLKILDFVRFERGEGVERKVDDFAEEVSKMIE